MSASPEVIEKRNPTYAEQIAARCVHFTGTANATCGAGVKYDDVTMDHEPVAYRRENQAATYTARRSIPCLQGSNYCGATCAKLELLTPDQVAAKVEAMNASVERVGKARRAIVSHVKATGEWSGYIDCPNCGAKLGYSQARSNGHIHARCNTAGCVAWME